jgi:hypothetical protein
MTKLTAVGTLLTANADDRTLTYRLLPYGEQGRTNLGRVTASKGVLTLPESPDRLLGNLDHDRKRPVARGVVIDDTDDGLNATFRIAQTTAGNDLLAEAADGLRTGASVEIEDPVIRNGQLLGGALEWVGFVTEPAFPSARLVAEDAGDLSPEQLAELSDAGVYVEPDQRTSETYAREVVIDGRTYRVVTDTERSTKTTVEPAPGEGDDTDDSAGDGGDDTSDSDSGSEGTGEATMTASKAATADASLRATAANGGGRRRLLAADAKPRDLFALLAKAGQTQDTKLIAELADITNTGAIGNTDVPQWVGELWSGRAYQRRIVPLFNHAELTSYKVNGWRWKIATAADVTEAAAQGITIQVGDILKPRVGPYTGDKAAVPSNFVKTEPVEISAERIAGAHDIDRKYKDFGDEGFWQSYIAAMTESYAVISDAQVMADAYGAATRVEVGTIPSGVSEVWAKIVDGVVAVLDNTNTMPTSAVLSKALYREFLLTPQDGGLEYLNASLGFEQGTVNQGNFIVTPHATLAADEVMVNARDAATVHELNTVPIRAEAENIPNGGIDVGVFGYYTVNVHDGTGIVVVEDPTP